MAGLSREKHNQPEKRPAHQWIESLGLVVIIVLVLAITISRYWHNIHWSAR